jgi:cation transport protein ChaC
LTAALSQQPAQQQPANPTAQLVAYGGPLVLCGCATLCPDCLQWGVAYRLAGSHEQQQETLQYLEWREKQYDRRVHVDIFTRSSGYTPAVQGALVYLATDGPQNVNWLGPAPLQDIAQQVATAAGPSGPNYEYVFSLADAMRKVG